MKKKVLWRMNFWLGQEKGEEEELVREFGTNMYSRLYFKWMANRHLLCSTGNLLNVTWQPG